MRKTAAIALLLVLQFNLFGYRLLYSCLQNSSDQKLVSRIDRQDYDESSLLEIRMALNLPYQNNWSDFERYDGEVELAGKHYKYVKRKVENDSLVLLCLPDVNKDQIQNSKKEFSEKHESQNRSDNQVQKMMALEYNHFENCWTINSPSSAPLTFVVEDQNQLPSRFSGAYPQPPEC